MDGFDNNQRPFSQCTCYGCVACFKREDALLATMWAIPRTALPEEDDKMGKEEEFSDDEEDIQVHEAPNSRWCFPPAPLINKRGKAHKTMDEQYNEDEVLKWRPCYVCSERLSNLAIYGDVSSLLRDQHKQCPSCNF